MAPKNLWHLLITTEKMNHSLPPGRLSLVLSALAAMDNLSEAHRATQVFNVKRMLKYVAGLRPKGLSSLQPVVHWLPRTVLQCTVGSAVFHLTDLQWSLQYEEIICKMSAAVLFLYCGFPMHIERESKQSKFR